MLVTTVGEDGRLTGLPLGVSVQAAGKTPAQVQEDIQKAYATHANCYLLKPADLKDFFHTIKAIEDFWLSLVKLPSV